MFRPANRSGGGAGYGRSQGRPAHVGSVLLYPRPVGRLSPWAWWLGAGPVVGGLVIGCLAGFLFVVDELINGYGGVHVSIVPVAVLIAGTWGAVGGFAAGCVCAVATWFLRRRGTCTEREYGRVGAVAGHKEQFESTGMQTARPKLLYTSRRGRRSRW